jgi:tetratricopeptide (TPR) repeat protein
MNFKNKILSIAAAISIYSLPAGAQGLKLPAPSPLQTVKQAFALSDITIEYSRPGAKNRVVYGDVVPFGKIWRTGANASTKVAFAEDVKVEGNAVASGTYALYTIPNKDSWEIIFYKDLKLGGNVDEFKKENELFRFTVKPTGLNDFVETFMINFSAITSTSCVMQLDWEKTRVSFNITADIDARVMKNIESSLANDSRPYFQAATYYYDTNKDLNKASMWVDKAIENNPRAYYMVMLKAKIQAKQNDKKGAIETARKVITLATEEKDDAYVKQAQKLIADLEKK